MHGKRGPGVNARPHAVGQGRDRTASRIRKLRLFRLNFFAWRSHMRSLKYSAFLIISAAVAGCSEEHTYHTDRVVERDRPVHVYDTRPDYRQDTVRTYDRDYNNNYDAPRTQTRVEVSGD